jgi:anti-sigma B factor antagonist
MAAQDRPLRTERRDDLLVLAGELDAHSAGAAERALASLDGEGDVRVDVAGVTFVDSSGLRVLLDAHQALESDGRRLVLVSPSRAVARLIELAGLVGHLQLDPPFDADAH